LTCGSAVRWIARFVRRHSYTFGFHAHNRELQLDSLLHLHSRAFVRDQDENAAGELSERPISPHPNLVTVEGLAHIDAGLEELRRRHAAAVAAGNSADLSRVGRDLRYWTARRRSAQVVSAPHDLGRVSFVSRVTIRRSDGRQQE
jgi:hypothetical protein